ncbi:MAG: diaminopimelate decarboxylase [Acidimicrobiia bacterium]
MNQPLPIELLPENASVAKDGELQIGGVSTLFLAAEFGTPLFVYDENHLRQRCREVVAGFGRGAVYATKAFLCTAMARLAHDEGMRLDVATGGEYHVARVAGVPSSDLVFHGNNKSESELQIALTDGVGQVVVDSFDELDRIEGLVGEGLDAPDVLLRITPGIEAHTHEFVRTGQDDSKFGFTVSTGAASAAVERARASNSVNLRGVHAHIGSQVFRADSFAAAVDVICDFARGNEFAEISLGGGLGVAYVAGEEAPGIADWIEVISQAVERNGYGGMVSVEPGRAIAAAAAVTLYTAGTIKHLPGIRTYVAVDGGMSDNPRPVLYGSGYETFLARDVTAERNRAVRLVGKHCETGDVLVSDGWLPDDLKVDDIVVTPVTGAYGHSMGSNYNKVLRPAVVFVRDGAVRQVVRRETYDDLLLTDLGPE